MEEQKRCREGRVHLRKDSSPAPLWRATPPGSSQLWGRRQGMVKWTLVQIRVLWWQWWCQVHRRCSRYSIFCAETNQHKTPRIVYRNFLKIQQAMRSDQHKVQHALHIHRHKIQQAIGRRRHNIQRATGRNPRKMQQTMISNPPQTQVFTRMYKLPTTKDHSKPRRLLPFWNTVTV